MFWAVGASAVGVGGVDAGKPRARVRRGARVRGLPARAMCACARACGVRAWVCARNVISHVWAGVAETRSDQIRSARVVCSRVRGLPARAMCACARACGVRAWVCARVCARVACVCARARVRVVCLCRPEGNGAMTQRWPFICAPRSDSRPWCPPGCSCGPQTPSYATKIAAPRWPNPPPTSRQRPR